MNRIDRAFKGPGPGRRKAFIAYITAGDPDLKTTARLVPALERAGADIIELGVPFSDPIADGPTIQAASQRALAAGATVGGIFRMVGRLRKKTGIPLVLMTYYNPVLRYGLNRFFGSCRRCGVDGVIVPDLPVEESAGLVAAARPAGVATIFLAAPTSTPDRISKIAARSRGFIYYVSLTGVTGAKKSIPPGVGANLRRIRSATAKPVAVGFGVSSPRQAATLARLADGVIVGSAIVKIISGRKDAVKRAARFAGGIARAVHGVR